MKLNPDCVRDVLRALEDSLSIVTSSPDYRFIHVGLNAVYSKCVSSHAEYTKDDVLYSLIQLAEGQYIVSDFDFSKGGVITLKHIYYITPKGHDLLSAIHNEEVWYAKIRPALSKLGSVSLSVMETVANGFASAFINKLTGI